MQSFNCKICKMFFTKLNLFRLHKKAHEKSDLIQPENIEKNTKIMEDDKYLDCSSCGKIIKQTTDCNTRCPRCVTNNIVLKKNRQNKKLCNKCGKILITLYKHKCQGEKTSGSKTFTCDKCGKIFNRYGTYWSHRAYKHPTKKLSYNCKGCHQSFNNASTLREHRIMKHAEVMPHTCQVCGKGFPTSTKIKRHMIIHSSLRTYRCSNCLSSFSQKSKLKHHIQEIHNPKQTKKKSVITSVIQNVTITEKKPSLNKTSVII